MPDLSCRPPRVREEHSLWVKKKTVREPRATGTVSCNSPEYSKLRGFFTLKIGFWKFAGRAAGHIQHSRIADIEKKPAAIARGRRGEAWG
jgi:hypothetical protein